MLFGAGWGLGGMCPGPALAALVGTPASGIKLSAYGEWGLTASVEGFRSLYSCKDQPARVSSTSKPIFFRCDLSCCGNCEASLVAEDPAARFRGAFTMQKSAYQSDSLQSQMEV